MAKYLIEVFKSYYCLFVFAISFVLSYFLVPKNVFYGWYTLIGILFMSLIALTITCVVRNVKEKLLLTKTYEGSALATIATVIGLASLQVCGIGAPVCGAFVGAGILSLFPSFAVGFFSDFAIPLLVISIVLQLVALYFMNCFKEYGGGHK